MSEQTETMLKNIREGMAMDGQAPHALTREQATPDLYAAEHIIINGSRNMEPWKNRYFVSKEDHEKALAQQAQELAYWKQQAVHFTKRCAEQGDSIAEDRRLLDQQAQEIERLKVDVVKRDCVLTLLHFIVEHDGDFDNHEAVEAEAIGNGLENVLKLKQQLAASQARVRELEEHACRHDTAELMAAERIRQLQATLAARERRVALLEEYQKRCEGIEDNLAKSIAENEQLAVERDTARQDAARLREFAEFIKAKRREQWHRWADEAGDPMPTDNEIERGDEQYRLAQKALKGGR